jgi:protein-S-isoprenylcysteine O-methyltransferase Ste14
MRRLLPPLAFLMLLVPLALLWLYHPTGFAMRPELALPWEFPLLAGIAALVLARSQFAAAKSEINTFKTPRELVTSGLFRFSRNPMYAGFTLLLMAAAMFVNAWCALLAPLAFFLVCSLWYIPHEERAMRETFGNSYDDYARRVRRWI